MTDRDSDSDSASFRPILVSAPAKIILHGEHAVVYGHTAIAASIGIRSRVNIENVARGIGSDDDDPDSVIVNFSNLRLRKRWRCVDIAGLFRSRPSMDRLMQGSQEYQDAIRSFLEPTSDEGACGGGIVTNSLVCFFYLYSVILNRPIAMEISAESDIPIGAGLGSSAAISVCLAAALLNIKDQSKSQDLKEINR